MTEINFSGSMGRIFFGIGITFNSLFGILAEPDYTYLLGMFAYSSLLGTKLIEDNCLK